MIIFSKLAFKYTAALAISLYCTGFRMEESPSGTDTITIGQNELPASLIRQYKRDASRMALRLEAEKEDLRYSSIFIPKDKTNAIYTVLANIWTKNETAKSIARCNVHTFPNPSIDNFIVIYKRQAEWAAPLRQGTNETTSPEINRLLSLYGLSIDKHVQWNETLDAITIRSRELLNMTALSQEFRNINGVVDIDMNIPKVAGNDIKIVRVSGGWEVEYIMRFGAYAGDPKVHYWRFKASDNTTVSLLKEGGDPIPSWMRCNMEEDLPLTKKG